MFKGYMKLFFVMGTKQLWVFFVTTQMHVACCSFGSTLQAECDGFRTSDKFLGLVNVRLVHVSATSKRSRQCRSLGG
jgi:hypothetical protein